MYIPTAYHYYVINILLPTNFPPDEKEMVVSLCNLASAEVRIWSALVIRN